MDPNSHFHSLTQHLSESSQLSRTPSRRQQFTDHEIKPLLSNLSPTSTLEALAATEAVPAGKTNRQSFIQKSVASASTCERAWGIKAALAGKKVRHWYEELLGWSWPGYDGKGSEEEPHWGSLPARVVRQYEERTEAIRDDMETLEVEDLKDYVRNTHSGYSARRASISASTANYEHLDDFTAIITATIVQTLPTLSRLNSLMNVWNTRLSILRQVPTFHRDLANGRKSMLSAWTAVSHTDGSTVERRNDLSRKTMITIQAVLQDQIALLGQKLDSMLDLLEGSKDTLPEEWIDGMDLIENEYSLWVVKAEEVVLHNALDLSKQEEQDPRRGSTTESGELHMDCESMLPKGLVNEQLGVVPKSSDDKAGTQYPTFTDRRVPVQDSLLAPTEQSSVGSSHSVGSSNALKDPSPSSHDGPASDGSRSESDPKHAHRPAPLVLHDRTSVDDSTLSSDLGSDISYPASAVSDYSSDKSSPEIRSASIVEFVASPALVTNPWSSREGSTPWDLTSPRSNLQTERDGGEYFQVDLASGMVSPNSQRSRASTLIPESVDGKDLSSSILPRKSSVSKQHTRTRSASMQSFEFVPKNEIRRIIVRRSESYTSTPSDLVPSTPETGAEPSSTPNTREIEKLEPNSATNAHAVRANNQQESQPKGSSTQLSGIKNREHSNQQPDGTIPTPPKTPYRFEQLSHLGPESMSLPKVRQTASVTPSWCENNSSEPKHASQRTEKAPPMSVDERLEARISSILNQIPADIRLTSAPEPNAPEITRFGTSPITPASRPSKFRMGRAQTSITPPTITLTPSQPKHVKTRSVNGEPEIKLYHLHQSGKDVPIKLFVRLVGEAGERVMVRIGGGWADLAEYLKEYASHHGRRSVSDTRFDIQGFPPSPMSGASGSSRPSTPASSKPSVFPAFKRQQTTPGKYESPQTPTSDPYLRSASRMSHPDEDSPSLGLAGPKTKNIDISPRKQAWVDEMMEQARGGNSTIMGDIGKVGSTKRVFLKGRSRAGSNV